jgi:hypothetical protein
MNIPKVMLRSGLPSIIIIATLTIVSMTADAQKLFFGNVPFTTSNAGGKTTFKSNEFIYGRMEVPTTIQQFFKVKKIPLDIYQPCLYYKITVYKNKDYRMGENMDVYVRITQEDLNRNYLNFDVLPQPEKATTTMSNGKSPAPLYYMFNRDNFPEGATYNLEFKIMFPTYDPYSPDTQLIPDKWPTVKQNIEFTFTPDDLEMLQANAKKATELVKTNVSTAAVKDRGLIKEWSTKAPITSGVTESELRAMIAAKLKPDTKIIKLATQPSPKGNEWLIEKNNLDIPTLKYHNQPYGVFVKNGAGRCYYVEGNLQKDYSGGGTYGDTYFRKYREEELDCKLIDAALAAGK